MRHTTAEQRAGPVDRASDSAIVAQSVPVRGTMQALMATFFWSSSALLIERLSTLYHLTALEISTWRVVLVLPPLTLFILLRRPAALALRPSHVPLYVVAGTGILLSNMTWAASVQINLPTVAAALSFSAPAFIAIGDRVFFHARLRTVQIGAVAVNLLGCGLASGVHSLHDLGHAPLGLVVGLSNGLAFAGYTLLNRGIGRQHGLDPLTTLFYTFVVASTGMLLWAVPVEKTGLWLRLDFVGWILVLCVALGPTLAAYAFFNSSLRSLPASFASVITTLEPPIVAVASLLLFGRTVAGLQWSGIGVIFSAVVAMQWSLANQREEQTAA